MPENDSLLAAYGERYGSSLTQSLNCESLVSDSLCVYQSGFARNPAKTADADSTRSYLDAAVRLALNPVSRIATGHDTDQEWSGLARGMLKTLPLFMRGKKAVAGLALTYVFDEAKIGDSLQDQATDAALGLTKAATLKTTLAAFARYGATPSMTGVGLGISMRFSETLLTRRNYYSQDGYFDAGLGMKKALSVGLNPASLAVDAATYGVADMVWARMMNYSRGSVWFRPALTQSIAGGTMGITSGFGYELQHQLQTADGIDISKLIRRSLIQGTVDGVAGGIGGWQMQRHMRLQGVIRDTADATSQARSTPMQKGESVDFRQAQLRDGDFIFERDVNGLTMQTWLGWVQTPKGEKIATIFRANDGTEAFAHRMQSEIASYGLQTLGFNARMPVTVARQVERSGKQFSGYVQELDGISLADYAHLTLGGRGGQVKRGDLLEHFKNNQSFRESYVDAWIHRMIMGEWDNHARNMSVRNLADGTPEVRNIDLGDGLRRAKTELDILPVPGVRQGYDLINAHLYSEMAGKKISTERLTYLRHLNERFDTPSGRLQLQATGMTPQQVEGLLGRMRWFVDNGRMPRQQEPLFYLRLNDARRWTERVLRSLFKDS